MKASSINISRYWYLCLDDFFYVCRLYRLPHGPIGAGGALQVVKRLKHNLAQEALDKRENELQMLKKSDSLHST